MIDKSRVAKSFGRAAHHYEESAKAQRQIVIHLMELLRGVYTPDNQGDIEVLELGSGTGLLSRAIVNEYAPKRFVINDITPEMAEFAPEGDGVSFICGDAENCQFEGQFDLVVSSSAMQWFVDPEGFIARMSRYLKKGGVIALSSFGVDNFKELKSLTGRGLRYHTAEDYRAMFGEGYTLNIVDEQLLTLHFGSSKELLSHLKLTGVNGGLSQQRLTISQTKRLIEEYDSNYTSAEGVPLSYNPIYMIATKK